MLDNIRTSEELAQMSFPDTSLVSEGILHEKSRLMLAGDVGLGKSYIALQLGWEASMGEPWLGIWPVRRKLKTLLIQVEVSEPLLQKRYLRLRDVMPDAPLLSLYTDEEFILEEFQFDLERVIDNEGYELVILDPLYSMHTGDENQTWSIRPTQRIIDNIRRKYGTTFIIVHHISQAGALAKGKPHIHMLRGSTGWPGWVDTVLLGTRIDRDTIKLHLLKARNREEGLPDTGFVFEWHRPGKFFKYLKEEESLSVVINAMDILGEDGVAKRSQVVAYLRQLGYSQSKAYGQINELLASGLVVEHEGNLMTKEGM